MLHCSVVASASCMLVPIAYNVSAASELPDCSWVASRMLAVKLPAWALPGLPSGPVL